MAKVAECDQVVIVLTNNYVKSTNCMLEVATLSEQEDWHDKAMVLVIDETIYSTDRKIEILNYWQVKKKIAQSKANEFDVGESILNQELEFINIICGQLEGFLGGISRLKNPSQIAIVNEIVRKMKTDIVKPMTLTSREEQILDYMKDNQDVTIRQISEIFNITRTSAYRVVNFLVEQGKIRVEGSGKRRRYIVNM